MMKPEQGTNTKLPLVSCLIPMRNEERFIGRCIESLFSQDYPKDRLEILIFDGESEDHSRLLVENLVQNISNCRLLDNPDRIQSAAWNRGVRISKGDLIGIMSAHVILAPDYVSKAVDTLLRTKADLVGGPVQARNQGGIAETIAIAMSTPFGVGGARFRYSDQEEETDSVFMGVCNRSVYERIGGFDEELVHNQDDEFSYRLLKQGGRILCNPEIRCEYYSRPSLSSLWKQYFQYGYWKVRVLQKHPRQMRLRQFTPPTFILSLILSALLALSSFFFPLSFSVFILHLSSFIPLLYLLANLFASLYTASKSGWKYLPLLPVVFAILHLSYGLGFLAGLVKFWNRWNDKVGMVPQFSHEPTR